MDFEPNEHAADGVTAGQARHNSSNVGGVTAGHVGHNSSTFNGISTYKMEFVIGRKILKIHIDQATVLQMVAMLDFWCVTGAPVS